MALEIGIRRFFFREDNKIIFHRGNNFVADCDQTQFGKSFRKVHFLNFSRPGHFEQVWCGSSSLKQEFYNVFFRNNNGQHDADATARIDNCIHILQLGHSETGAIQVPLYHKHNIVASEKASIQLNRCVVINSFGGIFQSQHYHV